MVLQFRGMRVRTYTVEVPDWLTVTEACSYLKVSRRTLYRWCDEGKLPYYEMEGGGRRRFDKTDLDGLLKLAKPQGRAHAKGTTRTR